VHGCMRWTSIHDLRKMKGKDHLYTLAVCAGFVNWNENQTFTEIAIRI
jgi:hypothetical protein